jgi:putative ABC transport system permease protein
MYTLRKAACGSWSLPMQRVLDNNSKGNYEVTVRGEILRWSAAFGTKEKTLNTLWQDLRFGARMLRKNPGFALVAILTLGLGVGANTAVFSLVHKILLAHLPVAGPERLVVVSRSNLAESGTTGFAHLFYRDLETERGIFDGVLCRGGSERVTLGTDAGGEPAIGELVSGSFFEVLGVKPHIGRLLMPSDDVTLGAHPVVVLSYR